MKDPGVDGCLPLVTRNYLSLACSARVRATESKSGCSHRACGNRHAREGVGEGPGGDMGGGGVGGEGALGERGMYSLLLSRGKEGLVSLSGQGRANTET